MKRIFYTTLLFALFFFPQDLLAQDEIYIPYRKSSYWGYADTNRNIIIPPIYSRAMQQKDGLFAVALGRNYGVVNTKNETIIDFKYRYIKIEDNVITVGSYGRRGDRAFYKSGEEIINKPLNRFHITNPKYPNIYLVSIRPSNRHGLLEISKDSNKIEKWHLDTIYQDIIYNYKEDCFYVYSENDYKKYFLDGTFQDTDSETALIIKKEYEEIFRNMDKHPIYFDPVKKVSERNKGSWIYYHIDSIAVDDYLKIVHEKRAIKDSQSDYFEQDTLPELYKSMKWIRYPEHLAKKDSINYYQKHILQTSWAIVANRQGKQSVINGFAEFLFPFEYDSIAPKPMVYNDSLHFKVMKNNKWGFVNQKGKVVVKLEYDEINEEQHDYNLVYYRLRDGFMVKKSGLWGVINMNEEIMVPINCDEINLINPQIWDMFFTVKNSKHGLYDEGYYAPPLFDHKLYNIIVKDGYPVILMPNRRGRVDSDLADFKGFYYFED